jgi:ABC-2 type transport system permease protein
VAAFGLVAKENSGFLHIALAQEPGTGATDTRVIDKLLQEDGAILFTYATTPTEAENLVRAGTVDEAWIFPGDIAGETQVFYEDDRNYVVQVITRENAVGMHLAREKIPAALFEYCAKTYYLEYIRAHIPQLAASGDGDLLVYFDQVSMGEELFVYGNPADLTGRGQTETYLTSPIRGLLAVLMLLGGMAATMFYMQDTAAGTFALVKERRRGLVALGCVMTAVIHIALMVLLSLCLSSLAGNLLLEMGMLLLYALCCSAFCLLLKEVVSGLRSYCAVLPLLAVVMVGVCPVFFDFGKAYVLRQIFPPTYYINAMVSNRDLLLMGVYAFVLLGIYYLQGRLFRRR